VGIERKVVSIRMEESLLEQLKVIAEEQNRPFSNLVETVMKEYASQWKMTKE